MREAQALLDLVSRKRKLETPPPTAPGAEEEAESDGLAADLIRALASGKSVGARRVGSGWIDRRLSPRAT